MSVKTEGRHAAEFVLSEAAGMRSRDNLKIPASKTIIAGMVLGALVVAAGVTTAVSADAGNTGTGVLTMENPAVNSRVKHGRYVVECIAAAGGGGTFRIEDPDGKEIGNVDVGDTFNKEVKFSIADGDPDFAVGDRLYIDVGVEENEDLTFVPYDQDGADGSERAAAIALYSVTTGAGETAAIAGMRRDCEVNGNILTWPDDITAAEKANAIEQLADRGIIVR